jgi:DNA invertase Pin-like site-specific DNA recombinase
LDCLGLDKFGISVLALVAGRERENIAARVKSSLKIAKERAQAQGKRLGNPRPAESLKRAAQSNIAAKNAFAESALVSIRELQEIGITSYNRLADCLNKRGEKSRLGKAWNAAGVRRVILATSEA